MSIKSTSMAVERKLWFFKVGHKTSYHTTTFGLYFVLFLLFVLLHKVVSYTPWQYEEHVECLLRRRHCLHGSLWFVGGINVARILVLSIVCQMLPVSLDSPYMIASSIFYDVYLECLIDFYGRGLLFFLFVFFFFYCYCFLFVWGRGTNVQLCPNDRVRVCVFITSTLVLAHIYVNLSKFQYN